MRLCQVDHLYRSKYVPDVFPLTYFDDTRENDAEYRATESARLNALRQSATCLKKQVMSLPLQLRGARTPLMKINEVAWKRERNDKGKDTHEILSMFI